MSIDNIRKAAASIGGLDGMIGATATPIPPIYRRPDLDLDVNPSKWMYDRIQSQIKDFEEDLDQEHEVGMRLVSFGPSLLFHVEQLGYHGPDMVIFYGKNELGEAVKLLQHISQLNVLLVAAKKLGAVPNRIGFLGDEKNEPEAS